MCVRVCLNVSEHVCVCVCVNMCVKTRVPTNGGGPHLGLEREQLVGQLLLLLLQQLVDLVGLDALAHQLEVGVVLLAELLHQTDVLLLHVLEGLARHVHLAQQRVLLLRGWQCVCVWACACACVRKCV